MKGPSLRYDLRVLRVFHCDACGREAQAPGNATSHTCPCSDPPKFMRPLERPRTVSPDVSAFISPAEPEDTIEEVEISDEDYVPYVPILPPRPERFPNRRKLSDDIEKYQGSESSADGDAGSQSEPRARRDEPAGGRGPDREQLRPDQRRDRPQSGDRSGSRPNQDNRDRHDRSSNDRSSNDRSSNDRSSNDRSSNDRSSNDRNDRSRPAGPDNARRDRPNDRPQERNEQNQRGGSSRGRGGRGPTSEHAQGEGNASGESTANPTQPDRAQLDNSATSASSGPRRSRGPRPGSGAPARSAEPESQDEFGSGLEPVGATVGHPGRPESSTHKADDSDADSDFDEVDGESEEGSSVSADGRPPRRRNRRRGRRRGRGQGAGSDGASTESQGPSNDAPSSPTNDG